MLLITLTLSLGGFFVTKIAMLCYVWYDGHGLKRMWSIAKLKTKGREEEEEEEEEKIPDEVLKDFKYSYQNCCRMIIPFVVSFLVIAGIILSFLSYDLHLLLCIEGISESAILYYSEENKTGRVDFDLPNDVLNFQLAAAIVVVCIISEIILLAWAFNYVTKRIIKKMIKYI